MTLPRRALVLLIACTAACASSPDGSESQGVVGCWYFEQDDPARELRLPWGVRLTEEPLTGWPLAREPDTHAAVTLVNESATADTPFSYWQPLEGDSLRIGYPGMGGLSLRLAVDDEAGALTGVAIPVGDAGLGERPTTPIRLTRAQCPAGP